jgi:hypothetical protein
VARQQSAITLTPDTVGLALVALGPRLLMIGALGTLPEIAGRAPGIDTVVLNASQIDADLLARLRPDSILAPLFDSAVDILDLAERLAGLGYRGRLRAVTMPLPAPGAVTAEIRGHCRGLDFALIEATGLGLVNGPPPMQPQHRQ